MAEHQGKLVHGGTYEKASRAQDALRTELGYRNRLNFLLFSYFHFSQVFNKRQTCCHTT